MKPWVNFRDGLEKSGFRSPGRALCSVCCVGRNETAVVPDALVPSRSLQPTAPPRNTLETTRNMTLQLDDAAVDLHGRMRVSISDQPTPVGDLSQEESAWVTIQMPWQRSRASARQVTWSYVSFQFMEASGDNKALQAAHQSSWQRSTALLDPR